MQQSTCSSGALPATRLRAILAVQAPPRGGTCALLTLESHQLGALQPLRLLPLQQPAVTGNGNQPLLPAGRVCPFGHILHAPHWLSVAAARGVCGPSGGRTGLRLAAAATAAAHIIHRQAAIKEACCQTGGGLAAPVEARHTAGGSSVPQRVAGVGQRPHSHHARTGDFIFQAAIPYCQQTGGCLVPCQAADGQLASQLALPGPQQLQLGSSPLPAAAQWRGDRVGASRR